MSIIPIPRSSPEELRNVMLYERPAAGPTGAADTRTAPAQRSWIWPIVIAIVAVIVYVVLVVFVLS